MRVFILLFLSMILSGYDFKEGGWEDDDIPGEMTGAINNVQNDLKSGKPADLGADSDAQNKKIGELNNIEDLESGARQKQSSEGQIINDILPDPSDHGMGNHMHAAKKVAESTRNLLKDLVGGLKQSNDINCKEYIATRKFDNAYFLKKSTRLDEYTGNEPFFCEHLRNTYDTKDDLEIHCLQFSSRPENIKINSVSPNVTYSVDGATMRMYNQYKPLPYRQLNGGMYEHRREKSTWFEKGAVDYQRYVNTFKLAETSFSRLQCGLCLKAG